MQRHSFRLPNLHSQRIEQALDQFDNAGAGRVVKSAIRFHSRLVRTIASVIGCLVLAVAAGPARAQLSANDGYAADGSYKLQVEITPYLWLPATDTKFDLGPNSRISGSVSSGVPSAAKLASSLHGAFMGYTLVRYGPWSAELDFDWVEATSNNKFVSGPLGNTIGITAGASMVRVSPGLGYQFLNSTVADMPVTVDARAGFAFFHWDATIASGTPSLNGNSSFVQPWLGGRLAVYPAPQWRVTLDAAVPGIRRLRRLMGLGRRASRCLWSDRLDGYHWRVPCAEELA